MVILPIDEMNELMELAKASPYYAAIELAWRSGARLGEICALKFGDVNLVEGEGSISISKQARREKGNSIVIKLLPKTHSSMRPVDINDRAVRAIKQHLAQIEADCHAARIAYNPTSDDFIFADINGKVWSPNRVYKGFKRVAEQFGRPEMRFHDLRHCHVSYLIKAGIDIKRISNRIGHKYAVTTLNTYSHLLPERGRDIVEQLDQFCESYSHEQRGGVPW